MILITGANGFVGTSLCGELRGQGQAVRAAVRPTSDTQKIAPDIERVTVPDLGPTTDWTLALTKVEYVVHLAARVHLMQDKAADSSGEYHRVNVEGTVALARAAAAAGVRRFVFLSSVKVNGERSLGRPFTEHDPPHPQDPYAISKWEAERSLWTIAAQTGLEVTVLRTPLVYGPGVRGNFLALLQALARAIPLPVASIRNRRSLIYVGNLSLALVHCIEHPAAAGRTFLVSDGMDVSTPELFCATANALGVSPRLLRLPPRLLAVLAALLGRSREIARLTDSLQVDSGLIQRTLNWQPKYTLAQGLAETAQWYHAHVGVSSSTQ